MKTYLGGGVYVEMKDLDVILTTEYEDKETNKIVLQPEVLDTLNKYLQMWFRNRHKKETE